MSIVTSQQLSRYFDQYHEMEVTFNKQVILATGLITRNVYLKVLDRQIPCIVFSSSMAAAKVIANVKATFFTLLRQANNHLALRWCFKLPDKVEPITFFVPCHAGGFTHYNVQNPDVQIISLEYTQRPADDLIQILGTLLEASSNAQRRKDERITITPENMKRLGLDSREASLVVDGTSRRCVLRDVSFGGAKVLTPGLAEGHTGKAVSLKIAKGEQAPEITLDGTIRRVDEVGGRKDIVAVGIEYSAEPPMSYKLLINSFLAVGRKAVTDGGKPAPARPPAPAPARPADLVSAPLEAAEEDSGQGKEPSNG
jgi:hypothetical protein